MDKLKILLYCIFSQFFLMNFLYENIFLNNKDVACSLSIVEKVPKLVSDVTVDVEKGIEFKVRPENLLIFATFLRKHHCLRYETLININCIDYWKDHTERFHLIYQFVSVLYNHRIFVRVSVNAFTAIPSLAVLYKSSNWLEREVWDMFGIFFSGHPDLRRILTDYGVQGFPLRKDYPTVGFIDMRYLESTKAVGYSTASFFQEYRFFFFGNSWL